MKKIILIMVLLAAKPAIGQLVNSGFETWDTTYAHIYSQDLMSAGVLNPLAGDANHWTCSFWAGNCQTTDSRSGNYALILHNWYGYAREWATYNDSISYRPLFLQGYFKYVKGGPHPFAQGRATVALTWFNGTFNDTIAIGSYVFDTVTFYVPFQVTLNYVSALIPDSISIYIENAIDSTGWSNGVSNLLYLDDLTLSDSPVSIEDANTKDGLVTIYPNPIVSELNIQNNSMQLIQFSLFNSLGEKIINKTVTEKINVIDLSSYPNGIYFYKVIELDNKITTGKIIKQ